MKRAVRHDEHHRGLREIRRQRVPDRGAAAPLPPGDTSRSSRRSPTPPARTATSICVRHALTSGSMTEARPSGTSRGTDRGCIDEGCVLGRRVACRGSSREGRARSLEGAVVAHERHERMAAGNAATTSARPALSRARSWRNVRLDVGQRLLGGLALAPRLRDHGSEAIWPASRPALCTTRLASRVRAWVNAITRSRTDGASDRATSC